jgi:hypothetical protein
MSKPNEVINDIRQMARMAEKLGFNPLQQQWFKRIAEVARPVKMHRAADVLDDFQMEYLLHVIKPEKKQCYKNAMLLAQAFPEIKYCEGKVAAPLVIDHAFNKVGDKYIDITFEFALGENPRKFAYAAIGEYDADVAMEVVCNTGFYGDVFRYLYIQQAAEKPI